MKKNCLCCGEITSHLDMPLELIGEQILCRDCAGNIIYDIKNIYKNMPEEEFNQLKNKIIEEHKDRFNQEINEVVSATIDEKYYGTYDMNNGLHAQYKKTDSNTSEKTNNKTTMFSNIGGKIKALAEAVAWIGIVVSVISGIVIMASDEDLILFGFIIAALGSLCSWISSFAFYGFGQLIENTDKLVELLKK